MKIKFKEQDFQLEAVKAVVDCFEGQKIKTSKFTLERSKDLILRTKQITNNAIQGILGDEFYENIGYRNSPLTIADTQILENIQKVQSRHYLIENKEIDRIKGVDIGVNLTIDMETGTGKTYAYIRTMHELYEKYGWSKYIVIVPSVAIREGVKKSFDMTQEHFLETYKHRINTFIYNSSRPQDIESFASDNRISVMIINTQAFAARGKDARRIYFELDQFGSRRPIDIISQTNPILIIDEPQSVGRVGSKSLESMMEFKPLFTLRYSATHAEVYNKIYRLDAIDAYEKKLVKKIQVKGINLRGSTGTTGYIYLQHIVLSQDKPPIAAVEFEMRSSNGVKRVTKKLSQGDNLFILSGELPAYKNCIITEIDGLNNKIVINGEDIYAGDVVNNKDDELLFKRIQIRETIKSHLEKESELFEKGIKVLSLFFIDSVGKYRAYDEDGQPMQGDYAKIFEEEYSNEINNYLNLFNQEYSDYVSKTNAEKATKLYVPKEHKYKEYLERDTAERVHNGYFSIDKKGRVVDSVIRRGHESSDDVSAYELIMKDKERLLSFDEPTRFIFSHSALKEGWDNPNVFQICALKGVDGGSEIRRRQEVGRGMRLCVDKEGIRHDHELIGDEVHNVNRLTVVASESYEDFAKGLQNEIAAGLGDRPQKADINFFLNRVVSNEMNEKYTLNKEDAEKLMIKLAAEKIIDVDSNYKITPEGKEIIEKGKLPLPKILEQYSESIRGLLKSVYTGEIPLPIDERKNVRTSLNKNFDKKEFQELWERINIKTTYEVDYSTEDLIKDSISRINMDLHVSERFYHIITGEQQEVSSKQELKEGEGMYITKKEENRVRAEVQSEAYYDLLGEIEELTNLKRTTIATILKDIKPEKFYLFKKNPEEFIAKSSRLINETKASLIMNNIVYYKTDERFDSKTVFSNTETVLRNDLELKKHIYDYINTDSKNEKEFVKELERADSVIVYAKLPRSFYISTPIANYSPDWAIVLDKEKTRHIYFVVETKGREEMMQLREIEKLKIECAKKHFEEISGAEVKFDVIPTYSKLIEVAGLK